MKFYGKYFFVWFGISLVFGNIFLWNNSESSDISQSTQTTIVELGSIQKSIDVVGDAELIDEQSLTFNKTETVTAVYVSAGDSVKKWDTLAKLDDSDAYDSIEEAKLNLQNAQITLNQLYESADESAIKSAENSILTTEADVTTSKKELENLKITQENALQKMKDNISTLEKEIENTKKEKDNSYVSKISEKTTTLTNIEENFKQYLIDIEDTLEESDTILGVSNERKSDNDSYEDYIGVKNISLKNDSKTYLQSSISLYDNLKNSLQNYEYWGDSEKMKQMLQEFLETFDQLYLTTDMLYKALDNSVVSSGILTESEISSMKSSISSVRSRVLSDIDTINGNLDALASLTDTDLEFSNNSLTIEKLELELENAQKELESTITQYSIEYEEKEKDLTSKQEKYTIAQLSLEELLEGPTDANVLKAKNSISQANIRLSSAYEDLEDYILTAPFDGIIRKIDYMVGDNLKDDNDKYVYIENPNLFEVSVMLDQIDIVEVEIGDDAIITFDTYMDTPANAKISNIDTTPVQSSGVVSYEVKLTVDDSDFDKKVLSGMTADVEIINEKKDDILLLKTSAITTSEDKKTVMKIQDGKVEKIEIQTGLTSDGMTEIISGLSEGDEILLEEFSIGWDEESSTTLFSAPERGNGPWRQ